MDGETVIHPHGRHYKSAGRRFVPATTQSYCACALRPTQPVPSQPMTRSLSLHQPHKVIARARCALHNWCLADDPRAIIEVTGGTLDVQMYDTEGDPPAGSRA